MHFPASGSGVLAGHLKNAFFHYRPLLKKRQAEMKVLPAKNYRLNLLKLRKRSSFSCL